MDLARGLPSAPLAFEVPPPPALSPEDGRCLVRMALDALWVHFRPGGPGNPMPQDGPTTQPAAAFVTLYTDGRLRGCLGALDFTEPLWRSVREMAVAAATRDPRFEPVEGSEYDRLSVEVSVLGELAELPSGSPQLLVSAIRVGEHGLSLRFQGKSGLLLPQVAQRQGWDALKFLEEICRKAGVEGDAWRSRGVELRAFRCALFSGKVEVGANGPGR